MVHWGRQTCGTVERHQALKCAHNVGRLVIKAQHHVCHGSRVVWHQQALDDGAAPAGVSRRRRRRRRIGGDATCRACIGGSSRSQRASLAGVPSPAAAPKPPARAPQDVHLNARGVLQHDGIGRRHGGAPSPCSNAQEEAGEQARTQPDRCLACSVPLLRLACSVSCTGMRGWG